MAGAYLAKHEDVDAIEAVCKRAFDQMGYTRTRGYEYDAEHTKNVLHQGIDSDRHIVTKYVRHGQVAGVMAMGLTDFSFYSKSMSQAFEIVWHGDPALGSTSQLLIQIALLKDMLIRMDACGVAITSISLDSQHLELQRLLQRFGFLEGTRSFIRRS